jgi:hypothetical protein
MAYKPTQQNGGQGGNAFSDDLTQSCRIGTVKIRSATYVDAIEIIYVKPDGGTFSGGQHGGNGGTAHSFSLAANETIVRVEGRSGFLIDQLKFTTNLGKVHGPYGGGGGTVFALSELQVGGILGRSATYLDNIGFFTAASCP